jgi:hemerythrin-like domain-containing protein
MNALRVLMQQHDRVEGLLVDLTQASRQKGSPVEPALTEFARELRRHLHLEDTFFYSVIHGRLILITPERFLDEHRRLLELLSQLEQESATLPFGDRLEALHDLLVQHVSDEEIELFPEVKRRLSLDELDQIGERIEREVEGEPAPPLEEEPLSPTEG